MELFQSLIFFLPATYVSWVQFYVPNGTFPFKTKICNCLNIPKYKSGT